MVDTTDSSADANWMVRAKNYLRTIKGTILAAETVISLIIIICYVASPSSGYSAVAICEMVFAITIFIIFMMEIDKQFQIINWLWTDLFRAATGSLVYLITSLICVIGGAGDGARIAGGVFGLLAGILFGYDAYTTLMGIRAATTGN